MKLASWWQRVGATLVDVLVMVLPAIVLVVVFRHHPLLYRAVIYVLYALYATFLIATPQGQTLGNRAAGTKVQLASTSGSLTPQQSLIRVVAQVGPVFILGFLGILALVGWLYTLVDWLYPLWDEKNQTIHDKAAGTLVVVK